MTSWLDNASPDVRALNADLYGDGGASAPTQRDTSEAPWMPYVRDVLHPAGFRAIEGGPGGYFVHDDGREVDLTAQRDWGDGVEEQWRYLARYQMLPGEGEE